MSQRAFRGKSMVAATATLAKEFAEQPHSVEAAREHLLDYRQHCIRWALEDMARGFEQDVAERGPGAYVLAVDLIKAVRKSAAKYERGEL